MHEITTEQLEHVVELVSNSNITYSHLPDDLIDHICCDIESEMSVGLSFNKALERVQCKFGDPGLQKIQEDTILLIDQKYRFMKTTMKIFGNVSLALVGIGTIFKLFHWPGASIALSLGFLLLGLVFYPATILASYRKNGRKNIFLHILAIIGGFALIFGVLFKFQHWPGASLLLSGGWLILLVLFLPFWIINYSIRNKNKKETRIYAAGVLGVIIFELSTLFKVMHWPGAAIMIILGSVIIVSVFLPLYAMHLYKKSEYISSRFIYAIILVFFFLLFGTLINLNFSKVIFQGVSNTNHYAKLESNYYTKLSNDILSNEKYKQPESKELSFQLHEKADSLSNAIQKIKRDMILGSIDVKESQIDRYLQNIRFIPDKTNWKIVEQKMFIEGNALMLKKGLEDYKELSLYVSEQDPGIKKELDYLLNIEDISEYRNYSSWENRMFKHNMLYLSLVQLSNIERNIRITENLILSHQKDLQSLEMTESIDNILK